ncbi:unnamed protein product [Somion occarium]|uniref:Shieldin complex subunit 2 first OB fold domain-containing protein n=1 Tax=Somion occarium TaxID=3059160 RepID=A0ABP1DE24_9APHY
MTRYSVFLGAPSNTNIYAELDGEQKCSYRWYTASSPDLVLPPGTLEAVSRRISMLYENIIFDREEEEGDYAGISVQSEGEQIEIDRTTFITWPPTTIERGISASKSRISFLHASTSISRMQTMQGTQETQETGSYDHSSASSITRFPAFHFSLHGVTSLAHLVGRLHSEQDGARKVNILVAILEVEGPDVIRVKKGIDAGKEVAVLKLILGDDDGSVCKLTAWREVAECWGGSDPDPSAPGIKRGDIVLLENVLVSSDPANTSHLSLTASPHLKSKAEICYRTMPNSPEDARFRPDLRLGFSDSTVRKVSEVVSWFESMAGLR